MDSTVSRARPLPSSSSSSPILPPTLQRRLLHVLKPLSLFSKAVLQPSSKSNNNNQPTPPPSPPTPARSSSSSSSYARHQRSTAAISLSSIGLEEFLSIYGLEGLGSRLRKMGFSEFEGLRRANPYHLARPAGLTSPSSRRQPHPSSSSSPSQSQTGLTDHEITHLFLALRMWDEEMGPEGEDLRTYLAKKVERSERQVFRKVVTRRGSAGGV
ncbi:hypothetical protein BDY24DRAFT_412337 [Mrakia frigida]|uniref:uncharacterized protein n=1 Tax=Mrakia frigida TaxID=29902 RepID=UPI003FCC01F3